MLEKLPSVDRAFIKSQVKEGYYTSEIEVVRDAVRRLREEQEKITRFKMAVMKGVEDIEAGRVSPYTPEMMRDIIRTAIREEEN